MIIQSENFSLQKYNTFGIDVYAKHFFSYTEIHELQTFIQYNFKASEPFFIVGGGSNLLFLHNYEGTIIHPKNTGIEIITETETSIQVKVGAGEIWDDFVAWAVEQDLYGIENLSLIPGSVGATAVQNIGAYGAEAGNFIQHVHTIHLKTNKEHSYTNTQCSFDYRNSMFKKPHMKYHIITSVVFSLQKHGTCNVSYGSLHNEVLARGGITLRKVREAIIETRNQKLPNPEEIGNAGSFFKNPIISKQLFETLRQKYPNIVWYAAPNGQIKIAAGWLIDMLGLKGFSLGKAQIHPKQALVLTNTGGATGNEIVTLATYIQQKVFSATGIELEPEVIYIK